MTKAPPRPSDTKTRPDASQSPAPEPQPAEGPGVGLPPEDEADDALSDASLDRAFQAWLDSAPEEIDPAAEPRADPQEEARERLQRLATQRLVRGILLGLVTLVAIFAMRASWTNMRYALAYLGEPPVDLGNLRERYRDQKSLDLPSNTYVRFRGAIPTLEAVSRNGRYTYFYSPLFHLLVQTRQELPPKRQSMTVEIPEALMPLVENQEIFPFDLTASFDGEGRLFRATEIPAAAKPLLSYYRPRVDVPLDELYVFFDADTPAANRKYLYLYLAAFVAFAGSLTGFLRTIRQARAARRAYLDPS